MKHRQQAYLIQPPIQLGLIGYLAIYLVFVAVVARTLTIEAIRPMLPTYIIAEILFIILYSFVLTAAHLPAWLLHLYFTIQSTLILWMISIRPEFDFLILLYLMLSAQVSLVFDGRMRWVWVGVFVLLSGGSLMFYLGALRGLSLSLTTIAGEIVIPAYVIVYYENELARRHSQVLLDELQEKNQRLQSYAGQVEDLAALQERNRLARQLHDSVSQLVFSISLTARSGQLLLESDPSRLPELLTRLQGMTSEALAQLRSLITRLRHRDQT
jgi:signal transduction histidine kinase